MDKIVPSCFFIFIILFLISFCYLLEDSLAKPTNHLNNTIERSEKITSDTEETYNKFLPFKNHNIQKKSNSFISPKNAYPLATPLNLIISNKILSEIKLHIIDKINGVSKKITVSQNRLVKNGNLIFKISGCLKNKSTKEGFKAFIDIWQTEESITNTILSAKPTNTNIEKIANKVFSGWIFSNSPSISHLEHRIYDIRLLHCI